MPPKPAYKDLEKRIEELEFEIQQIRESDPRYDGSAFFFKTVIHQSPYAIWISDREGTLIDINAVCCELLSVKKEDVINSYNIFKDESIIKQGLLPQVKSVFEKGRNIKITIEHQPDQLIIDNKLKTASRLLDLTISPIKNPLEGGIINAIFHYEDITARNKAKNDLIKAAREWKTTFNAINDAIWILDKDNHILHSNKTAEKSFFKAEDKVIGKYCWEIAHGTSGPIPRCPAAMAKTTLKRSSMELYLNEAWLEIIVDPILDEKGKYAGSVHIVSDITKRKKAEDALQESQRKLATLMSNLPGMAYRCKNDADWTMEFISDGCRSVTGYNAEELTNSKEISYGDLIHAEDRSGVWDEVQRAVNNKEPFKLLYRIINPRQEEKWVWEQGRGIYDEHEELIALEGFISDITERIQAENDVKNLQSQLLQARKMESVGRLAGGVAHDFNNMLSVIMGNAEMALFEIDSRTPLYNRLKQISEAADRSANITRQLLGFARKQTIKPVIMDLNISVEEMLRMLRRLIGENIELSWKPGQALWKVKMDPAQLDQILANLCVNAKDAIKKNGKIVISTKNITLDESFCSHHPGSIPGEYVMLSLSDNGAGIEKEILENIFEPFFTTKGEGQGTGLGLSTIYGIVKQNDGFIDVKSEPGKGTTFLIFLPKNIDKTGKNDIEDKEYRIPRGNGEVILVVEDEDFVLDISRNALEKSGYSVLIAKTPNKALEQIKRHRDSINLLLTDLVMPEMSGKELADEIIKIKPDIKTLFMSGYTPDTVIHHGILEKDINFIQKPFTISGLANKVFHVLNG